MGFQDAVKAGFQNYFAVSGRASRSEFWLFLAFIMIAGSILSVIEGYIFPSEAPPTTGISFSFGFDSSNGPISAIFSIVIFIPWMTATVRRLHDIGKNGWLVLIGFIPIIGWLVMLMWTTSKGDEGPNDYGPNPLDAGDPADAA